MRILNLGYGLGSMYSIYKNGNYPSHFLYGMPELEKKGIKVKYSSLSRKRGIMGIIENTRMILCSKCNIVFFPYIYTKPILGIVILKTLKICRISILGVYHSSINNINKNSYKYFFYKQLYKSFDKIFFYSPLNMKESLETGLIIQGQATILHWGVDIDYYNQITKSVNKCEDFFISTGRENRDFKTLLNAFSKTSSTLHLYTNINNFTQDYSYLLEYKDKIPNILIQLIENDNQSLTYLAEKTAKSFCVVIPLPQKACYYCVGHTSIVEALALGKPIIVSKNCYHPIDVEKEQIGIKVNIEDPESFIKAINFLNENKDIAQRMGNNAKKLAEEKYNTEICANEIYNCILRL